MNNIYLILILFILFINIIQYINDNNNHTIAKTTPLISKHYEWYGTKVSNNKYEIIPDYIIETSDLDLRNKNLTHEVFGYISYTDVVLNKKVK
jgi:hypothetical protein